MRLRNRDYVSACHDQTGDAAAECCSPSLEQGRDDKEISGGLLVLRRISISIDPDIRLSVTHMFCEYLISFLKVSFYFLSIENASRFELVKKCPQARAYQENNHMLDLEGRIHEAYGTLLCT